MPRKTDRRKDAFLAQLKRKQGEWTTQQKPVSEMSEAELDAEEARLREEIRRSKEQGVAAARDLRDEQVSKRSGFLPRRRRRYWK